MKNYIIELSILDLIPILLDVHYTPKKIGEIGEGGDVIMFPALQKEKEEEFIERMCLGYNKVKL